MVWGLSLNQGCIVCNFAVKSYPKAAHGNAMMKYNHNESSCLHRYVHKKNNKTMWNTQGWVKHTLTSKVLRLTSKVLWQPSSNKAERSASFCFATNVFQPSSLGPGSVDQGYMEWVSTRTNLTRGTTTYEIWLTINLRFRNGRITKLIALYFHATLCLSWHTANANLTSAGKLHDFSSRWEDALKCPILTPTSLEKVSVKAKIKPVLHTGHCRFFWNLAKKKRFATANPVFSSE